MAPPCRLPKLSLPTVREPAVVLSAAVPLADFPPLMQFPARRCRAAGAPSAVVQPCRRRRVGGGEPSAPPCPAGAPRSRRPCLGESGGRSPSLPGGGCCGHVGAVKGKRWGFGSRAASCGTARSMRPPPLFRKRCCRPEGAKNRNQNLSSALCRGVSVIQKVTEPGACFQH